MRFEKNWTDIRKKSHLERRGSIKYSRCVELSKRAIQTRPYIVVMI